MTRISRMPQISRICDDADKGMPPETHQVDAYIGR